MAKLGEPCHPNAMKAVMSEKARYFSINLDAAAKRRNEMVAMVLAGKRNREIAEYFGLSCRRVEQILRRARM